MLRAGLPLPESFEAVAREWFYKQEGAWAKGHREKIVRRLERDVFPWLGARPIVSIKPADVLQVAATALRSVASFNLPCPRLPLTRAWHGHGHGRALSVSVVDLDAAALLDTEWLTCSCWSRRRQNLTCGCGIRSCDLARVYPNDGPGPS